MLASRRTEPAAARHARWPPAPTSLSCTRIELQRLWTNQDRDRFCCRCPALQIMIGERQQRIGLGIIGADRAHRDTVRFSPETAHDTPLAILGERLDLDHVALHYAS